MPDDLKQPVRVDVTFDYQGRTLSVVELRPGWRVAYGDRIVVEAHLDRALARAIGIPAGSQLELIRRILNTGESTTDSS
jgi:hypothetical protein